MTPEADRHLHIDLEVDVHGGEVNGSAAVEGDPVRTFAGWLGLLAALDALVEAPGPPAARRGIP